MPNMIGITAGCISGGQGGGVALPSLYLGPVASRGSIPNVTSTSNKGAGAKTYHQAMGDITAIKLLFANFYVDGTFGTSAYTELADGNVSRTASVAATIGGTRQQVLFSGAATDTRAAGGIVESDWLTISIPNGQWFEVNNWHLGTTRCYASGNQMKPITGEGLDLAASPTDKTMSGSPGAAGATYSSPPVAVLGMTRKGTVLILDNSRARGVGDTLGVDGLGGPLERAIGGAGLGFINASVGGDSAFKFATNSAKRRLLAPYCSAVVWSDLINDIDSNNRTAVQALADLATCLGFFSVPKYIATVSPYTTGSWGDLASQTVRASESKRLSLNASIRAGLAGVDGYFDHASAVEDGATGKWLASMTSDGLHENQLGCTTIASSGVIHTAVFVRAAA